MSLTAIILFIVLGIILLLLEVLVIPGFSVPGIIGILLILLGIYFAYRIDNTTGHLIFASSFLASVALIFLSLRAKTWNRVMLKTQISGRINVPEGPEIKAGDEGITISRIAPMGKVEINGQFIEVSSYGEFINENTQVKVIKVEGNKVFVTKV